MGIQDCRIIHFRKISDPRGNLTPIEGNKDVPFEIKRIFYLYDVPGGSERAGHAHKTLEQVVIAISGSFDVIVKDNDTTIRYHLNRSHFGLYLPNMLWREIDNFSSGAVCLALASQHYDEAQYIRDYPTYSKLLSGK